MEKLKTPQPVGPPPTTRQPIVFEQDIWDAVNAECGRLKRSDGAPSDHSWVVNQVLGMYFTPAERKRGKAARQTKAVHQAA